MGSDLSGKTMKGVKIIFRVGDKERFISAIIHNIIARITTCNTNPWKDIKYILEHLTWWLAIQTTLMGITHCVVIVLSLMKTQK